MKRFCILIALALLLTGCMANNKKEMEMLSYQLNVEQQQRLVMEKKINELEEKLGQTDTSLREEISQSNQPVRFNQANISEEVRSLRTQLAKVQGELEEINKRAELQEQASANETKEIKRLTTREKELSRKLQQISSQLGVEQTDIQSGATKTPKQIAGKPTVPPIETSIPDKDEETQYTSAQTLYKKALEAFYAKEYAKAQNMWGEFTTSFPNNQLTPNAYFWHGEAAYQQQNYAQAVLSYQQVISKYKKSNKYAPALLKQGISFFKLGKKEAGTIVLNDLIKQLPESFEATRAKTFLKNPK